MSAVLPVRVEHWDTPAGLVSWVPSPAHRVRVHAGPPARCSCSGQSFVYTRGEIDLVPAGGDDTWCEQDPSHALLLSLEPAWLQRAADELGLSAASLEPRHQLRDPQIEHLAWALDAEREAGNPSGSLYTESVGLALAVHLLHRYRGAPEARSPAGLTAPRLRRVLEHIEEHIDGDLTLAALADVAGLSASHLKTLFRVSTGLPVHQYVLRRRAERARSLLRRGEMPISEVALRAGFAHQSHMARWLRRVYGLTPSELARP